MKETRSHAFSLVIDSWLMIGQGISALKIFEQVLQNVSITDYAISLLVFTTSTALSSLSFYEENSLKKGENGRISTILKCSSYICAILLLLESGMVLLMTIAVPFFAKYFPITAVYIALIVVPLRQVLKFIYDCINLWHSGE